MNYLIGLINSAYYRSDSYVNRDKKTQMILQKVHTGVSTSQQSSERLSPYKAIVRRSVT